MAATEKLLQDIEARYDEYFRSKNCTNCPNLSCPRDHKNIEACISDKMIENFDRLEQYGD
jgi:hypothetical protein